MNRSHVAVRQPSRFDFVDEQLNHDIGKLGYVNYINGVPVESPLPKKKKQSVLRNNQLPSIKSSQPQLNSSFQ